MIGRRGFLQGLGAGAVVAACGSGSSPQGSRTLDGGALDGGVAGGGLPPQRILVVVNIDGGNDWLQMMQPTAGANRTAYEAKRPTLGTPVSDLVDLGSGVGLSRDFTGMDALHAAGKVAWVAGIGMNNPNLSHFISIDLWGQGATSPNGTGWLGRFADAAFDATGDVLRGLTVTSDLPVMLKGAARSFVSITGGSGYVYPSYLRANAVGAPWDAALLQAGFGSAVNATSGDAASGDGYAAGASSGALFLAAQKGFGTGGTLPARTPSVLYPGDPGYPVMKKEDPTLSLTNALSPQLKLVAQMIASGLPAEVYFCRLSGWDTHANELRDHPNLQRALGGSLAAFHEDLASIPSGGGTAQDRVMVLGYSEFGRRVAENRGGTDHGTAGLAFCLGNAVKGGLYGAYPDLGSLDANGNMKFTTDFRSLYATVLDRWLDQATSTTDRLLGTAYPRLGFL